MLVALRFTAGSALARLRQLTIEPDPVLLLGREARWRWPWTLVGLAAVYLLLVLSSRTPWSFEAIALRQGWIAGPFSSQVFPFEPDRPLSYVFDLLCWLPFLLPPLAVLVIVHGVSWRRAFSYGMGFQWRQFWQAALALLAVVILTSGLGYLLEPQQHRFPTYDRSLLPWTVLAFGLIFVQTLGEDVLFRGYLLRTLGAVLPYRIPVTAAVIALFVSNHLGNQDFRRDMVLVVSYFVVMEMISYALLFRTQNLAAAAGLHWMTNTTYLLFPDAPELVTKLALAVYIDPVYTAGGSRLLDPMTHLSFIAFVLLLLVLLLWRRSPFYLPRAPLPVPADRQQVARGAG
jgi:membrane protease YdiL (CAAX protease family)